MYKLLEIRVTITFKVPDKSFIVLTHIIKPLTFPFSFRFIVSQFPSALLFPHPWWGGTQSSLHVEPSCLLLPSNWRPACGGPVDWSRNSLPLFCCHSSFAWFRPTIFLASLAQQQARVNFILEPLPVLVLALIVYAPFSEPGGLSEILGFESEDFGPASLCTTVSFSLLSFSPLSYVSVCL